jgi:hypothetical protein
MYGNVDSKFLYNNPYYDYNGNKYFITKNHTEKI